MTPLRVTNQPYTGLSISIKVTSNPWRWRTLSQRLDAVALGGVMACGVEVHAHLAGGVDGLLGLRRR